MIKIKLNLWDIREACKDILNFIDGVSFHDFQIIKWYDMQLKDKF